MNKEEIQKRIAAVNKTLDEMVSKGKIFSEQEMTTFEHLTFELESLTFKLRNFKDGTE